MHLFLLSLLSMLVAAWRSSVFELLSWDASNHLPQIKTLLVTLTEAYISQESQCLLTPDFEGRGEKILS